MEKQKDKNLSVRPSHLFFRAQVTATHSRHTRTSFLGSCYTTWSLNPILCTSPSEWLVLALPCHSVYPHSYRGNSTLLSAPQGSLLSQYSLVALHSLGPGHIKASGFWGSHSSGVKPIPNILPSSPEFFSTNAELELPNKMKRQPCVEHEFYS